MESVRWTAVPFAEVLDRARKEWVKRNREVCTMTRTDDDRIANFRTVYRALLSPKPGDQSVAAIASIRLLLIDAVGEDRQRELIGLWNGEVPEATPVREVN